MMRKTICVLLAALMCMSCFVLSASASVTLMNVDEDIEKVQFIDDAKITGTVYISISKDGRFVESNGEISDTVMAYVAVPLSELAFDLRDYGYENYIFDLADHDPEAAWRQPITLLHLFIYTLEHYYEGGWNCNLTGAAGSSYIQNGFWGHDENLTYYVDGAYPLESANLGATSDHICLVDGDFADVQMYSDWSFWSDNSAGFHYFLNNKQAIVHKYSAHVGVPFTVTVGRAWGSLDTGGSTKIVKEKKYPIYYARTMYDNRNAVSAKSDEAITFSKSGTYYMWADGSRGTSETNSYVSSPAYAKITVSAHDFSKKTATEQYLKTAATCTQAAQYYYACSICGAAGTSTYEYGEANGHTAPNAEGKCDVCQAVIGSTAEQPAEEELCKYCHQPHTGTMGGLIKFVHSILYFFCHLFGKM